MVYTSHNMPQHAGSYWPTVSTRIYNNLPLHPYLFCTPADNRNQKNNAKNRQVRTMAKKPRLGKTHTMQEAASNSFAAEV